MRIARVIALETNILVYVYREDSPFSVRDRKAGKTMHWLWVIIIGFLAGVVAKWFVPGPHGFIVTTLLGIVGAIVATWLGQHIGWYGPGQGAGFIGAIVGAVIILAIYRSLFGGPT